MDQIPEMHTELQTFILAKLRQPLVVGVNSMLQALVKPDMTAPQLEAFFTEMTARLLCSGFIAGWEEAYDAYKSIKIEGSSERRKIAGYVESFLSDFRAFIAKQAKPVQKESNSPGHRDNRLKRLEP